MLLLVLHQCNVVFSVVSLWFNVSCSPYIHGALQGCYKDKTNGTRNCWYFAALYLIITLLLLFFVPALTLDVFFYAVCQVVLIAITNLLKQNLPFI